MNRRIVRALETLPGLVVGGTPAPANKEDPLAPWIAAEREADYPRWCPWREGCVAGEECPCRDDPKRWAVMDRPPPGITVPQEPPP